MIVSGANMPASPPNRYKPAPVGPAGSWRIETGPAFVAKSTPWTARCTRPVTEPPGPGTPRRPAACALASSAESDACWCKCCAANSPPQTIRVPPLQLHSKGAWSASKRIAVQMSILAHNYARVDGQPATAAFTDALISPVEFRTIWQMKGFKAIKHSIRLSRRSTPTSFKCAFRFQTREKLC